MNIAVDLRTLHPDQFSGVEIYTAQILEHVFRLDRKNHYRLFYSGMSPKDFSYLDFINTTLVYKRLSNRLLNLSLKFSGRPAFENLIGDFDLLFLPNFSRYSIRPDHKLVVAVHDLSPLATPEFYHLKSRLWHRFLSIERTLRRADVICAVSEYTKQDIMRFCHIAEQKIQVIHPGIDHRVFRANLSQDRLREVRNRYGLPGDFVLFINTIEPRKNLIGLIEAMERLDKPVTLVIAGKMGWKYRKTMSKIKSSPRRRHIKYLGYIPEQDKPYIMKLARLLAYPSIYEGFGFQPLEAMAVGTPVLTSPVTSLPEIAGDASLMVDPYDNGSLAAGIQALLTDEPLRARLISRGLERVKLFDWDRSAARLLEIFDSLCA
jgi:glycosyltransferase involved in cell wall biosynthesis